MESVQVTFMDEANLVMENLPNGRDDRVVKPFRVGVRMGPGKRRTFEVPAGFVTDWASVPRFLWRLIPSRGSYNKAALVHDYLYRVQPEGVTRRQADQVFLDAMRHLGVAGPLRWAMYQGVRLGGWLPWRRNAVKKAGKGGGR